MIYLGRSGKISGPFSESEFDELIASGEIENFRWVWEPRTSQWKPIELPPPSVVLGKMSPQVSALCSDGKNILSGRISQATETGCDLSIETDSASPRFAEKSRIKLHLLDESSGAAVHVPAKILSISRSNGQWSYRVRWDRLPEILG